MNKTAVCMRMLIQSVGLVNQIKVSGLLVTQKSIVFLFIIITLCTSCIRTPNEDKLQSPNGEIRVEVFLDKEKDLKYRVFVADRMVVKSSQLGLSVDGKSYGKGVSGITLLDREKVDEVRVFNNHISDTHNYYKAFDYQIETQFGQFYLNLRLYDDGVAFRYSILDEVKLHVDQELTEWNINDNPKVWFFERNNHWKLKSYAGIWSKTSLDSLHVISEMGPIQGNPLIMDFGDLYLMLSEAALYNYSGMRFRAENNGHLTVDFSEGSNGFDVDGSVITPWRVLGLYKNLDEMVNSELIKNLNPYPSEKLFDEMDWIKPGKSVWSWWSLGSEGITPPGEKKFIDAAAALGFEYTLIDEGWENWSNSWIELEKLTRYGEAKGVGVWVWKHSNEIRDIQEMQLFLNKVKDAGVVGVKTDFMNSESKEIIDFDIEFLREAAKRKLMVNFHGCQTSSGEYVTYPNELTREGVRGIELNKMKRPLPASHNAALPFTRLLTGPADYTPLAFSLPGETTWGHELATAFMMDSYFICMAENPSFIFNTPGLQSIVPLLKGMPVSWDKTKVLDGSAIGKTVLLERVKDEVTYLVALNGESVNKEFYFDPAEMGWAHDSISYWVDDKEGVILYKTEPIKGSIQIQLQNNGGAVIKLFKN